MANKAEEKQERVRRFSNALDRQIKGIQVNAKIASDATYSENWKEVLSWLNHAQSCVQEAIQIGCDLRDLK